MNFVVIGADAAGMSAASQARRHNPDLEIEGYRPDDVLAVGLNGTILHWDGSEWTLALTDPVRDLQAVWGSASNTPKSSPMVWGHTSGQWV